MANIPGTPQVCFFALRRYSFNIRFFSRTEDQFLCFLQHNKWNYPYIRITSYCDRCIENTLSKKYNQVEERDKQLSYNTR